MNIGSAIREIRKEKGISQENLALKCGLSRAYIYRLEAGINSPTIKVLEKIAIILNVKVSDIVLKAEELS